MSRPASDRWLPSGSRPTRREELQRALVRSHATGMGPPVEREVVRAMMLLRARSLAMGWSGARPVVAERILALLNAGLTPVVPEHGSFGASGDLAPLAHCALPLIGEGTVMGGAGQAVGRGRGARWRSASSRCTLGPKEGLALINGTDGMLGMLVMACADLGSLLQVADIAAAMSVEALLGTDRAFAAELLALRPQPGQAVSARNLRALLDESAIVASHRVRRSSGSGRLLAALRASGDRRRSRHARARTARGRTPSCARRSTTRWCCPMAASNRAATFTAPRWPCACDFLAIGAAEVGAIAERRTDRLLDSTRSHGLPAFLAEEPGVNSGLMIAHYSQAAMVAENRRLAAPASVDSIPTSAMQEDHVSMGWGAARKLRAVAREPRPDPGDRGCLRGTWPRPASAASPGARNRGRAVGRAREDPRARSGPMVRTGARRDRGARQLGRAADGGRGRDRAARR